jgi:hypothetical protein
MSARPLLDEKFKRTERLCAVLTKEEFEKINRLCVIYNCRDRSEYMRKTALGEIKVDPKKLEKQ